MHSPEDHAILEAAYQANSKPDKAERIAIVNRVELGEKEVQARGVPRRTKRSVLTLPRYGFKIGDKMTDESQDHSYLMNWFLTSATPCPMNSLVDEWRRVLMVAEPLSVPVRVLHVRQFKIWSIRFQDAQTSRIF